MSIIVYRDGILAADTGQFTRDRFSGATTKIARGPAGELAGETGESWSNDAFLAWVRKGMLGEMPKQDENSARLLVMPDGSVRRFENGHELQSEERPWHAIGYSEVAIGALEMGATAAQAVELCCKHYVWCRGPVETLALGCMRTEAA